MPCPNRVAPGGCQLHNLHCNYPACEKSVAPVDPIIPAEAANFISLFEKAIKQDPESYSRPGEIVYQITLSELIQLRKELIRDCHQTGNSEKTSAREFALDEQKEMPEWLFLAKECLLDVVSHYEDFISACDTQYRAELADVGSDSAAYWEKQKNVLSRMKSQAEVALAGIAVKRPPSGATREVDTDEFKALLGAYSESVSRGAIHRESDVDSFINARSALIEHIKKLVATI